MHQLDESAKGVFIISVTPFTDSGDIDLASTDSLMEFYLERGVNGVTVLGMMGEAPKLSYAESLAYARHAIRRVGGRVPVVVGVSASGLAPLGDLARAVMDAGASGVMVAPPPGLRGDDGVITYFRQVADALGRVPFALQDYPQANGVFISASTIRRIIDTTPSCVMLKHEDCPGLTKLSAVRAAAGRRVSILVGNGGLYLPEELRRGADGAMTGFAFPEMMVEVVEAHARGDSQRAADLFDAYLPLVRYEQQPGIGLAVRKHILARRGAIATSRQRVPASSLSSEDLDDITFLLARQAQRLNDLGVEVTDLLLAA